MALLLLCALANKGAAQIDDDRCRVHLRVVSQWGTLVTQGRVLLVDTASGRVLNATLAENRREPSKNSSNRPYWIVEGVPHGKYEVRVRAPLYGRGGQLTYMIVARSEQWATVTLPLEPPLDPWRGATESGSAVRGLVTSPGRRNLRDIWIKVISIYSDIELESSTGSNGEFELPSLPDGRYIAVLTPPDAEPTFVQFVHRSGTGPLRLPLQDGESAK